MSGADGSVLRAAINPSEYSQWRRRRTVCNVTEDKMKLIILTPEQDEAILRDAGFSNVSQFYDGFTFRGWVGYA